MCLLAEVLLVETPLDEDLLLVVLLAVEEEMVLAESVFLEEKEKIPPKLEKPEGKGELPLSGALFVLWYSWHLFSSAGWTGGHQHLCFWSLPMRWSADTERKTRKYKFDKYKNKIGIKIEGIP
jgi:hypothetical protein